MIRINQIKLNALETEGSREKERQLLLDAVCRKLRVGPDSIGGLDIIRRSIDARDRDRILFVYAVNVTLKGNASAGPDRAEKTLLKKLRDPNVLPETTRPLQFPKKTAGGDVKRPVIVGSGPCGLFAALSFLEAGIPPLILERGEDADSRIRTTQRFFRSGVLDPESNIQFGEGGAGTFSDGKLNTSIKGNDPYIRYVLEQFCRFGADESILYDSRPHVGSDVLPGIVKRIRLYIEEHGGEYLFNTSLIGLETAAGRLRAVRVFREGREETIPAEYCLLAIGHSARDTYGMLERAGLGMCQKSFALGFRFLHPQLLIDRAQYGEKDLERKRSVLGPAVYKLSYRAESGRGIYSFCMCPGGYVVNSSSEQGMLCINGMSLSGRDSDTANAAIVVSIDPAFYGSEDPLAGVRFQQELEQKAFALKQGAIPYECFSEFSEGCAEPKGLCHTSLNFRGAAVPADLRGLLPEELNRDVIAALRHFGKIIDGYDGEDALMAALEARTSSPVRILRNDRHESNIPGIFPAGEGAGYAGGITSAAVDGIKTALKMIPLII